MERSILEMLSDRSSAPTLLGCRPSARKSLGRSQKIFQLLTKSSFWSLHHDNTHYFKANSLLNLSCPRWYVGRGPDTMIVVAGDLLRTVSIRLLKSLFSVSVCRSLALLTPRESQRLQRSRSSFRILGICAETSRTRASGKQWVCTLLSANVARTCRTIESPMITASHTVSQRGAKRLRVEISKSGGGEVIDQTLDRIFRCCTQGPGFPGGGVQDIWEDCVPGARGTRSVQKNTQSRGGGSVSSVLHTYPDLWTSARDVSSVAFRLLSWTFFPSSSWICLSTASQLQLHRMQLECVLTCIQR